MAAKSKRTTPPQHHGHQALCGARREGRFKDIQTYKRAEGQDVRRKSKKEKQS